MPLVARWGSEVRTTSPLEPGSNDPRPLSLTGTPVPISLPDLSKVFPANTPKPLKRFDTASEGGRRRRGGTVDPPLAGLDINGAQVLPAPANGLDLDGATIIAPANGLDIDSTALSFDAPANGLDIDGASILAPANGLDIASAALVIDPPAAGLDIVSTALSFDAPANGLDVEDASVIAPAAGLDIDGTSVIAPAAGLDIDGAEKLTLNIEIVSDQSFADSGSGSLGEIKYSSDVGYLFIFDGTNWQRTNGGNS